MEVIDLYTKDKEKLGKTFVRHQDTLLENEYYLLEQAWILNEKNEILLTQRVMNKSYGGLWEATAGHVKAGETDLEGIQREVKEELGVDIEKSDFKFIKSLVKKQTILDVWVVKSNISLDDIHTSDEEVMDVKYVSIDEFKKMIKNGEVVKNLDYFVEIYDEL